MNPLIPPLHVSAAYVALASQDHGASLLSALRAPSPPLALVRLWEAIRAEIKATSDADRANLLTRIADVVFYLQGGLDVDPRDAAHVVGVVVKILTPPPSPPHDHLWTRPGVGSPWALRPAAEIPPEWPTVASPRLAAVYRNGDAFAVIGADETFATYDEAATVSEIVGVLAHSGIATGLRAATSRARRETPGAESALALAKRLAGAVEGL